jgi:hypothetical protein
MGPNHLNCQMASQAADVGANDIAIRLKLLRAFLTEHFFGATYLSSNEQKKRFKNLKNSRFAINLSWQKTEFLGAAHAENGILIADSASLLGTN